MSNVNFTDKDFYTTCDSNTILNFDGANLDEGITMTNGEKGDEDVYPYPEFGRRFLAEIKQKYADERGEQTRFAEALSQELRLPKSKYIKPQTVQAWCSGRNRPREGNWRNAVCKLLGRSWEYLNAMPEKSDQYPTETDLATVRRAIQAIGNLPDNNLKALLQQAESAAANTQHDQKATGLMNLEKPDSDQGIKKNNGASGASENSGK